MFKYGKIIEGDDMKLLRFSKEEEKNYSKAIFKEDVAYIRYMLIFTVIIYSFFGFIDTVAIEETIDIFFIIRFYVIIPLMLLAFLLSFTKSFRQSYNLVITILYTFTGLSIVLMLGLNPLNFSYYGGLFLVFGIGFFLTKVKWQLISLASIFIVIIFIIVNFLYINDSMQSSIIYSVFYSGFILICIYATFNYEQYRRKKYMEEFSFIDDKSLMTKEIHRSIEDIKNSNRITIYSLARLAESKDKYTGDHIERVGDYCLKLANELDELIYIENNVEKDDFIESIELASTLHDIGKIAINESILMKPGPLTEEEVEIMKLHTVYGCDTLTQIKKQYKKNAFINMGVEISRHHHENWDGTGYPDKISGRKIPLSARLVAVVDVFDALISERPYKPAFSYSESIQVIKSLRGKKFDPEIVDAFIRLFKTYNF